MDKQKLLEERELLTKRLEWLGIKSTGSERIEKRIKQIDNLLKTIELREKRKKYA